MQQLALLRLKGSAEQQDANAWCEKPGHGMAPGERVLENTDREREMGNTRGLREDTSYCYALRTSRGSQLLPRLTNSFQRFRCGANGGVAPCSARRSTFARRLRVLRATHRLPFLRLVPGRPPAASRCGRKVRAPQGKVAGNARRPRGQGKCHRDQTAGRLATATVRVKRRGKSSPRSGRLDRHGKPHLEEDRIGGSRCPRPDPRVGRWRASARTLLEKWPPPPSGGQQNPAYGDQASHSRVTAPRRAQPNFGVCARMRRALLPARRSSSRTTLRSLGRPGPAAR